MSSISLLHTQQNDMIAIKVSFLFIASVAIDLLSNNYEFHMQMDTILSFVNLLLACFSGVCVLPIFFVFIIIACSVLLLPFFFLFGLMCVVVWFRVSSLIHLLFCALLCALVPRRGILFQW